ncbi:MAG: RNA-binding protein [Rhodobacteraceae bacterium]|jgi:RNA recognition motif-containing protein|nr:RNA-binding protein [Paracoccaceae bacterium]MDA9704876.1 RNA-binding protein [SAR86 cluster bacterium]GIR51476.1 MAG: RNA-binding protein [Gammaproteobacteria bacterium]|tara:strand:- start:1031 stop:1273 length:243 start_codon:yes stop_codon:yes gene_type:complete
MNIYVGNIPWSVTDDQLEELFAQFGTVTSAKIIVDKFSKRSRGFGFVEMADGGEQAIAALNDKDFEGRPLVVNESRSKDS